MEHKYYGSYSNVALKPLCEEDIEHIRVWRNDADHSKYLRKIGEITPEMQKNWFLSYLKNQDEIIFGIHEQQDLNRVVGSLSLYNFSDNGRAEIGKILIGDPAAHGRGIGRLSLIIALKIAFELLGIHEVFASVHQENTAARNNDLRIGFKIVGKHPVDIGGFEDEIVIHKEELYASNKDVEKILIGEKW